MEKAESKNKKGVKRKKRNDEIVSRAEEEKIKIIVLC